MSAKIIAFPLNPPTDPPLTERLAARRAYREMASAAATVAIEQAFKDSMRAAARDEATASTLGLDEAIVLFLAALRRELRNRLEAG